MDSLNGLPLLYLVCYFSAYFFARGVIFAEGLSRFLRLDTRWRKRAVYRVAKPADQVRNEIKTTGIIAVLDAVWISLVIKLGAFSPNPYDLPLLLGTFAAMFVWFEIWFYFTHRLMHLPQFFWIHKRHHESKVTDPWTSLSFSIPERLILVFGATGLPALATHFLPISGYGILAYFFTNYLLNVYGHSNTEWISPSALGRRGGQFLNTATYHALHHARYKGHYGLFTPYLDHLFETRFEDYESVHRLAYEGRGPTKLHP